MTVSGKKEARNPRGQDDRCAGAERSGTATLIVDGLTKRYAGRGREVVALEDVSLELEPGTFSVLQGPSGSGKTTLLLSAGGLLSPDEGRVFVEGHDLYTLSGGAMAEVRARCIGFVFQQFHLVPYLTVFDNVLLPEIAHKQRRLAGRAAELLATFRLDGRADHYPSELSTGERQRVALARALLGRPALLLADEPTGNLDDHNAGIILECLDDFVRAGGTVLMATHGAHRDGRDAVYMIEQGRIVTVNGK